jgi:ribosomal protein S27AE
VDFLRSGKAFEQRSLKPGYLMTDRLKKFCPNCGDRIKRSTTSCPYCGQRVITAGLVLKYIIIAVMIVAAVFLVLLYLNKSKSIGPYQNLLLPSA